MRDSTNERSRLHTVWSGKRARWDTAVQLGAAAEELMVRKISPRVAKFGEVTELWGHLLPAELS